jgi:hypothetical protein
MRHLGLAPLSIRNRNRCDERDFYAYARYVVLAHPARLETRNVPSAEPVLWVRCEREMLLLCRVGRKFRLWPVAAGYVVRTAVCSAATRPAAQDGNTTRRGWSTASSRSEVYRSTRRSRWCTCEMLSDLWYVESSCATGLLLSSEQADASCMPLARTVPIHVALESTPRPPIVAGPAEVHKTKIIIIRKNASLVLV